MTTVITRRRPLRTRPAIVGAHPPRLSSLPVRSARPAIARLRRDAPTVAPAVQSGFAPDPYVDYSRRLTAQGGIAIIYKDLDLRLRHTLRRLLMWSCASGIEAWLLLRHSPVHHAWLAMACWAVAAVVNWLIVKPPVEIYRTVEIRPDCMIIDGADVFWLRYMEGGRPGFRSDVKGNRVLSGTYGTRAVEYLTVRRFDEFDRVPEVFAAHLQDAMQQLWMAPQ